MNMTEMRTGHSDSENCHQLVRKLKYTDLMSLGSCFNDSNGSTAGSWQDLADGLGFTAGDLIPLERKSNPGGEVLKMWCQKPNTTCFLLRTVLEKIGRKDVADKLCEFQNRKVFLTVVLLSEDEDSLPDNLSGRCCQTTQLIDFVRPKIQRKLSNVLCRLPKNKHLIVEMKSTGIQWTHQAKSIEGQQVTLKKRIVTDRREFSEKKRNAIAPEIQARTALSYQSDDNSAIYFEYASGDRDSSDDSPGESDDTMTVPVEEEGSLASSVQHQLVVTADVTGNSEQTSLE